MCGNIYPSLTHFQKAKNSFNRTKTVSQFQNKNWKSPLLWNSGPSWSCPRCGRRPSRRSSSASESATGRTARRRRTWSAATTAAMTSCSSPPWTRWRHSSPPSSCSACWASGPRWRAATVLKSERFFFNISRLFLYIKSKQTMFCYMLSFALIF